MKYRNIFTHLSPCCIQWAEVTVQLVSLHTVYVGLWTCVPRPTLAYTLSPWWRVGRPCLPNVCWTETSRGQFYSVLTRLSAQWVDRNRSWWSVLWIPLQVAYESFSRWQLCPWNPENRGVQSDWMKTFIQSLIRLQIAWSILIMIIKSSKNQRHSHWNEELGNLQHCCSTIHFRIPGFEFFHERS